MARYFKDAKISQIHGHASWMGNRFIIPMYHPAAGLHQPKIKPTIIQDFKQLSRAGRESAPICFRAYAIRLKPSPKTRTTLRN